MFVLRIFVLLAAAWLVAAAVLRAGVPVMIALPLLGLVVAFDITRISRKYVKSHP